MTVAYLDDIDQVQYKFTELGQTIEDASKRHKGYFKDTVDSLTTGFDDLKTMISNPEFQKAYGAADMLDSRVSEMSELFGKVLAQVSESFGATITASEDAHQGIAKIADALKTATEQPGTGGVDAGGAVVVPGKKKKKRQLPKTLQKEISTLKSSAYSMMGKLKIPKPGTLMAGGVMAAAYGFTYKDRVQKEMGEIKNTLESAADYGMKGVRRKGVAAFSALQENLQRYVGIAKGEVQAITKTFAGGGVTIGEMLSDTEKKFGRVGRSAVHSSLALDKMFGVPGGTMAQKAVGYMHNYGMSLKEANEMTRDLHLNDQAFKIGVPTFVQNVENAAESLKDFGFSIRGVMDLAGSLQDQFEKIGLPKQFAGKLAGIGVQQIAQGIAGMSDDWKALMGQKMYGKTGLEAVQRFEEGFTRVKEGGGTEEYMETVRTMYQVAKDVSEGDEAQMYAFISRNAGWGGQGARATMEIGKIYEEKGGIEAVKATEKHMKTFKSAFETEKEKDSKFRQKMNLWMEGVSDVGMGLLGLVGKALAYLIGLFRAYPYMFGAMFSNFPKPDFERVARIQAKIRGLAAGGEKDWDLMKRGFGKMGDAGQQMFGDVFESSMGSLGSAFTGDLSGGPDKPEGRSTGIGDARQTVMQTVYVPVESQSADSTYPVRMDPGAEKAAVEYSQQHGLKWHGGRLSILSKGVDEHGNIELELVGSCPQCGLKFGGGAGGMRGSDPPASAAGGAFTSMGLAGEGKHTGQDVEAAGRVLATEMGGYDPSRHKEAVGILQTLMNRGGRRGGGALYKKATSGHGWGKQAHGSKRQYASRRKFKEGGATERFVRKFLQGDVAVPENMKKVRGFFHARQGDVFRGPQGTGYKGAVPHFARGGGITAVEESKPGKRAFFYTPRAKDTAEGAEGRAWATRGLKGGSSGAKSADTETASSAQLKKVTGMPGMM